MKIKKSYLTLLIYFALASGMLLAKTEPPAPAGPPHQGLPINFIAVFLLISGVVYGVMKKK